MPANRNSRFVTLYHVNFCRNCGQPSIWVNLGQVCGLLALSLWTGEGAYTGSANMGPKKSQISSEVELLRKIERSVRSQVHPSQNYGVRFGIGDDAALWEPRIGFEAVLTTDWFLEGTHFLRRLHPPDSAGWKCLTRAVSDIAAMGGEPRCFLLSLALPENETGKWLDHFLAGLGRASRKLRCPLIGGDTTRRDEILINICVIGEVKKRLAIKRSGTKPGDRIFVSGRLGEAELGLKLVKRNGAGGQVNPLLCKHLYPEPRIELGKWLSSNRLATAMIDLSDGLSLDVAHLCATSRVGAQIYSNRLPMASKNFSRKFHAAQIKHAALHGGDDYELLFCVARKVAPRIPRKFLGIELTEIGEITKEAEVKLIDPSGQTIPLRTGGWDPFRK